MFTVYRTTNHLPMDFNNQHAPGCPMHLDASTTGRVDPDCVCRLSLGRPAAYYGTGLTPERAEAWMTHFDGDTNSSDGTFPDIELSDSLKATLEESRPYGFFNCYELWYVNDGCDTVLIGTVWANPFSDVSLDGVSYLLARERDGRRTNLNEDDLEIPAPQDEAAKTLRPRSSWRHKLLVALGILLLTAGITKIP